MSDKRFTESEAPKSKPPEKKLKLSVPKNNLLTMQRKWLLVKSLYLKILL